MNPLKLFRMFLFLCPFLGVAFCQESNGQTNTDLGKINLPIKVLDSTRERDGLLGPVRRVRVEVASLRPQGIIFIENIHSLLEVTLYNVQGQRIENVTYPVSGNPVGLETHKYDDRGHLIESVVQDKQGVVLNRLRYQYKFDAVGNWTKMVTLSATEEGGRVKLKPVEVTYREIEYYVDGAGKPTPEGKRNITAANSVKKREDSRPANDDLEDNSDCTEPSDEVTSGTGRTVRHVGETAASMPLPEVGVINKKALKLPWPTYAASTRQLSKPLKVIVEVVVDVTGSVVSVAALQGPPELRRAAEEAAGKAVFRPFKTNGRPTKVRGFIYYTFSFRP